MEYIILGQSGATNFYFGPALADFKARMNCDAVISAKGGSAALEKNASASTPNNYWVTNDMQASPLLTATAEIAQGCDRAILLHGEQEATRLLTYSQKDEYKSALQFIVDQVGIPVFIVRTGRRENADKRIGTHLVQLAQTELALENEHVHIVCDSYDLDLRDHIHYSDLGKSVLVDRMVDYFTAFDA